MTVLVNEESRSLPDGVSLQTLVADLGLSERKGIAIAVNDLVIARTSWESCKLKESDRITLIQATQGG